MEVTDDTPLTLKEACEMFFRNTITPKTLRAEAGRGTLTIMRIGRQDFVTPQGIKGMMVKTCRAKDSPQGSTSAKTKPSGSSETARNQSAQAAALMTAQALKKHSRNTSRTSSSLSAKVVHLASASPRS